MLDDYKHDLVPLSEMMKMSFEERESVRNGLPECVKELEEEIIKLDQNINKKIDNKEQTES